MNLSPHFSFEEFTASDTARRLGIMNDIPLALIHNAQKTAEMLERIREFLGKPMRVTSGFRCLALNRAIGSKDTSDHVKALACDFQVDGVTSYELALQLAPVLDQLGIGQLIYEHTWIHVGVPVPDRALNRILTVQGSGYIVGVHDGF